MYVNSFAAAVSIFRLLIFLDGYFKINQLPRYAFMLSRRYVANISRCQQH